MNKSMRTITLADLTQAESEFSYVTPSQVTEELYESVRNLLDTRQLSPAQVIKILVEVLRRITEYYLKGE